MKKQSYADMANLLIYKFKFDTAFICRLSNKSLKALYERVIKEEGKKAAAAANICQEITKK